MIARTEYNKTVFKNASKYIKTGISDNTRKYLTDPDELSSRIGEAIADGIKNGGDAELIYNNSKIFEASELKDFYPKEVLIDWLERALVLGGVTTGIAKT